MDALKKSRKKNWLMVILALAPFFSIAQKRVTTPARQDSTINELHEDYLKRLGNG